MRTELRSYNLLVLVPSDMAASRSEDDSEEKGISISEQYIYTWTTVFATVINSR